GGQGRQAEVRDLQGQGERVPLAAQGGQRADPGHGGPGLQGQGRLPQGGRAADGGPGQVQVRGVPGQGEGVPLAAQGPQRADRRRVERRVQGPVRLREGDRADQEGGLQGGGGRQDVAGTEPCSCPS